MVIKLLLFLLIVINGFHLSAAVSDGDKVIIYSDGSTSAVTKFVEKELKSVLKQRKIKIDERGKKGSDIKALVESLEKEVVKKKPNLVLITCPIADIYDVKKKSKKDDFNSENYLKNIDALVASISEAGLIVGLATPAVAGEDLSSDVNITLDKVAEQIRTYCEEKSIPCCDYRRITVQYLKTNNPDKKHKGILTKDGVQISKDGAAILAPALRKCLGMSSNIIGGPLVASDRIIFFTSSGSPFAGKSKTLFKPSMQSYMDKKFPQLQSIVRPSFKILSLPDRLFQKHPIWKDISQQKARVSFVHVTHQLSPPADYIKYNDTFKQKMQACCKNVAEAIADTNRSVFLMTEAIDIADPNDPLRKALEQFNQIIIDAATEHDLQIFDLNTLFAAQRNKNPTFSLWLAGGQRYYSDAFMQAIIEEMATIVGITD